jgi:23S rRNA maturation mini-RNase III
MSLQTSRYSAEETARRGDEIYEQQIRSLVEDGNRGKVVAIDVESGAYAVAEDALSASHDLLDRLPDAEIWCVRVGSRALYRMGGTSLRGQA